MDETEDHRGHARRQIDTLADQLAADLTKLRALPGTPTTQTLVDIQTIVFEGTWRAITLLADHIDLGVLMRQALTQHHSGDTVDQHDS